jgi:hypothetical protein
MVTVIYSDFTSDSWARGRPTQTACLSVCVWDALVPFTPRAEVRNARVHTPLASSPGRSSELTSTKKPSAGEQISEDVSWTRQVFAGHPSGDCARSHPSCSKHATEGRKSCSHNGGVRARAHHARDRKCRQCRAWRPDAAPNRRALEARAHPLRVVQ